jgi:hypothetical protein
MNDERIIITTGLWRREGGSGLEEKNDQKKGEVLCRAGRGGERGEGGGQGATGSDELVK